MFALVHTGLIDQRLLAKNFTDFWACFLVTSVFELCRLISSNVGAVVTLYAAFGLELRSQRGWCWSVWLTTVTSAFDLHETGRFIVEHLEKKVMPVDRKFLPLDEEKWQFALTALCYLTDFVIYIYIVLGRRGAYKRVQMTTCLNWNTYAAAQSNPTTNMSRMDSPKAEKGEWVLTTKPWVVISSFIASRVKCLGGG